MFDIKSFYEAKDVKDAVEALVREPEAEVISGGTDVLIRVREGKDAGRALVSIHNIKELKGVKVLEPPPPPNRSFVVLLGKSAPPEANPNVTFEMGSTSVPSAILMGFPMMVLESTMLFIFSRVTSIRPSMGCWLMLNTSVCF